MGIEIKLKVLVCGGGNGVYCLVGLLVSNLDVEICVLILFVDEVECWFKIFQDNDLIVIMVNSDGFFREIKFKLILVINDFKEVVLGVDVIFLVVLVFVYEQYFREILFFVGDNMLIVGFLGQVGFEF